MMDCRCKRATYKGLSSQILCVGCFAPAEQCACPVEGEAPHPCVCGEMLRAEPGGDERPYTEVHVGPHVSARVCVSRVGRDDPRADCVARLRAKLAVCPGCAAQMGFKYLRAAICSKCVANLERAEQLIDKPVTMRALDSAGWFGWSDTHDDTFVKVAHGFLDALASALAVGGRRRADPKHNAPVLPKHTHRDGWGKPKVELDSDQVVQLERASGLLHQLVDEVRRRAFAGGASLLGRLASGEATTADFEEQRLARTVEAPPFDEKCESCRSREEHSAERHYKNMAEHLTRASS